MWGMSRVTIFPKGKTRHHMGLPQATCLSPAPNPAHGAGPCLPPFYTAHGADPRCWPEPCLSSMPRLLPMWGWRHSSPSPPRGWHRCSPKSCLPLPLPPPSWHHCLRKPRFPSPPHVPLRPTRGARPTFWAKMGNCPVCSCQLMIHWQEQTGQMPISAKKRSSQLGHGLKRDCPGQNGPYGHLRNED